MKNRYSKLLLLGLLTLIVSGCEKNEIPKPLTPLVETYLVPISDSENLQSFTALVQASDLTSLGFKVSGEITEIFVSNGSLVKRGDKIAVLDATDFILDVENKRVKTDLAKVSMERAQKMVALGNMAQGTFDELEAQYRIALASHQLANTKLSYVTLYAPFDGIIASVPADSFQNTQIGERVVTMHRTDKLEVRVELPDVILAQASANAEKEKAEKRTFDVTLDAYPKHVFKALYKEHTLEQNNNTKTYHLILEIKAEAGKVILPGMPGSVMFDLAKIRPKLTVNEIPLASIVSLDNQALDKPQKLVWRITEQQTVESVEVVIGKFTGHGLVEVIGDLNPGDRLAVSGLMYLKENSQVISIDPKEMK